MQLAFTIVFCLIPLVYCFPEGAPKGACKTLLPNHENGTPKTNGGSLYKITADKSSVNGGQSVKVTIQGLRSDKFKGFLMVATAPKSSTYIGKWTVSDKAQVVDCVGQGKSVTHTNGDLKRKVDITWTAPKDFKGKVEFRATIVKAFDDYYSNVKSSLLTVK